MYYSLIFNKLKAGAFWSTLRPSVTDITSEACKLTNRSIMFLQAAKQCFQSQTLCNPFVPK